MRRRGASSSQQPGRQPGAPQGVPFQVDAGDVFCPPCGQGSCCLQAGRGAQAGSHRALAVGRDEREARPRRLAGRARQQRRRDAGGCQPCCVVGRGAVSAGSANEGDVDGWWREGSHRARDVGGGPAWGEAVCVCVCVCQRPIMLQAASKAAPLSTRTTSARRVAALRAPRRMLLR